MSTQPAPTFNEDRSGEHPSIWIKASLSYANGGCVEVAARPGERIIVRDSKNPAGAVLGFSSVGWNSFVGAIRNGEFDRR
jgi:hypothetical protein